MKKLVDNEDFAKNSYLVIFFENLITKLINTLHFCMINKKEIL